MSIRLALLAACLLASIAPGLAQPVQSQSPASDPTPPPTSASPPTTVPTPTPAPPAPAAKTPAQPAPAQATAPKPPVKWRSGDDCVADNKFRRKDRTPIYPPGDPLISTTYFLPAGTSTDLVWKTPYDKNAIYFGKVETRSGIFGGKNSVTAKPMPDDHPLIKKGVADKTDTLVTLQVAPQNAEFWRSGTVFLYACDSGDAKEVSALNIRVSSSTWSTAVSWGCVLILYLFAALTAAAVDTKSVGFFKRANPVFITAGADGKGSLAKLQILFFSMIVFGLLLFIVLRTGILSDLSTTVLALLGIAAVGSTAAKATDVQKNRIEFDNWTWFMSRGWLPPGGLAELNQARWRDIVTSDGEFDVYRYQCCLFSLVVGGALLAVGIHQLASFSIPESLLGVLGLSQVVYVAGKLVSPPSFADLNKATAELRALEKKFATAVATASPANRPATLADARALAKTEYENYRSAVDGVRVGFEMITGRQVRSIEPSY